MRKGRPQERLRLLRKIFEFIIDSEENTPEGRVNTIGMFFGLVVALLTSIFSGMSLEVRGGSEGWSFSLSLSDSLGSIIALIVGILICALIVAGSNYFREYATGKQRNGNEIK